jgi:ketopantoate reductase
MKVVVVGSGALGGYFGFTFASQGQDVVLVDIDPANGGFGLFFRQVLRLP